MSEKQWTLFRISIPNVILGTHINPTVIHRFSEIQMAVTPVLCPATSLWEFDHEEGRRRRKKGKVTFGSQNGFFSKTWFQLENIGKAYLQKHFKPSIVTYLKNVPIGEVGGWPEMETGGCSDLIVERDSPGLWVATGVTPKSPCLPGKLTNQVFHRLLGRSVLADQGLVSIQPLQGDC